MGLKESAKNTAANIRDVLASDNKGKDAGLNVSPKISPTLGHEPGRISTILPNLQPMADPNAARVDHEGLLLEWFYSPILGQPRNININNLRVLAQSTWPAININNIVRRISNLDWEVMPKAEWKETVEQDPKLKAKLQEIKRFFSKPNNQNQSMEYLISGYVRSLMEVDSGVFIKVFNKKGDLKELTTIEGATMVVNVDMFGNYLDPAFYQYSFIRPQATPISFLQREVVYGVLNPQPGSPYGRSPTQYIEDVANILMDGIRYNKNVNERNQIPSSIWHTSVKLNDESKERVRAFFEKEVPKNPNALYLFDDMPDLDVKQLALNQRDAEFLNSQEWFSKVCMAAFGTTPAILGFTEGVNKASQAGQESIFFDATILPITKHISQQINRYVLPEFFTDSLGDFSDINFDEIPFEFKFFVKNRFTEERDKEGDRRDVQMGAMTVNEYRRKWNIEDGNPLPGGDLPAQPGGAGLGGIGDFARLLGGDGGGDKSLKKKESAASKQIKLDLEPVDEAPEDSIPEIDNVEAFSDFQEAMLTQLFDEIDDAIRENRLGKSYKYKAYKTKALDTFLGRIGLAFDNYIQSIENGVNVVLSISVNEGIGRAEEALDVNLPAEAYQSTVAELKDQVVNGYIMDDGARFDGLRNESEKLRSEVTRVMREGVEAGLSESDLASGLKPLFEETNHRARTFARTELSRASNRAELRGWEESGVVEGKEWVTAGDGRVRPNHAALHGVQVGINENFNAVDAKGNAIQVAAPPLGPSCRCSLSPIVKR